MMKDRMDNTGTLSIWSTSRIPTHPILRMPNPVYSLYHIMLALESQYFNSLEIFYEYLPVYFLIGSCWSSCKSNVLKILHMGFPSQRILNLWVQSPNDDGISIVLVLLPCLRSVPLAWKEVFSVDRILFEHHKLPISINYRPHSYKAAKHLRVLFPNILPAVLLKPIILGRHRPMELS